MLELLREDSSIARDLVEQPQPPMQRMSLSPLFSGRSKGPILGMEINEPELYAAVSQGAAGDAAVWKNYKSHKIVRAAQIVSVLPPGDEERSGRQPEASVPPMGGPQSSTPPVDCVFATVVLSASRMLAVCYWAQSRGHNKPLILLNFTSEPLDALSWTTLGVRLNAHHHERRSRYPRPLGAWIEGEPLVAQAFNAGLDARMVPAHLTKSEMWNPICLSAASHLSAESVAYTAMAKKKMDDRPFLNATIAEGRGPDPLVPAFLYGIVIALDDVLARDPHPKMPVRSRQ